MNKKILITGARGLIGKEALPYLKQKNYEVFALTTSDYKNLEANWFKCDLTNINSLEQIFKEYRPDYLLHFAWITGGDYLTNPVNEKLKDSSFQMLKLFYENGGKRAIYAGTCFEYDFTENILSETDKTNPKTLYAKCKNMLRKECFNYTNKNNLSFGWGRIFYVFGNNEKSTRLTAAAINALSTGQEFNLTAPNNCVDYMYTKDIAQAFIRFLESDYNGIVNICNGKGILLKDYILKIQELLGQKNLVKYDDSKTVGLKIIGDNSILKNTIGYIPKYTIEAGLKEIIKNK